MTIINELFTSLGLGEIKREPQKITGGLMHSMYMADADSGRYAVKVLNPSIMAREGVLEHITQSERAALSLKEIVPAVSAKVFDGKHIIDFRCQHFIIFDWIDARSVFPPDINAEHCSKIGDILGRIHNSNVEIDKMDKCVSPAKIYNWDEYIAEGRQINAKWVNCAEQILSRLKNRNEISASAENMLNKNLVLSHRDMDPKNVMWQSNNPYLIDWEAAGYINPYKELIEALNYWSDNGSGGLIKENFVSLLNAYKVHDTLDNVDWTSAINSGYGILLGWLNYSFVRALGRENNSNEDRQIGHEQIEETITELINYEEKTGLMAKWVDEII